MPEAGLRKGGQRHRFDEMAVIVNDRIDNPSEAGVERYVGLEHLDSDSLTIRRWGSPSEVEATKLVFRKGDIIFGRRRVYQRKLAVADFDGICSAHAMVLRARPEVVLDEFLPFFMQSDLFMERAKEISVGSLSPTINWKTLAKEEFVLPPLEMQRRLCEVLSAAIRVGESQDDAAILAERNLDSFLFERIRGSHLGNLVYDERFGRYSSRLNLTPVRELLIATQYGISEAASEEGKYPMLRMMDLSDGLATGDDLCLVDLSADDFDRYKLADGDVLFNRTNSHDLVGRTGVYRLDGNHVFASYLVRLRTDVTKLLPDYLSLHLNAPLGRRQVMRFATRGVSQTNVNVSNLKNVLIPLPSIDYQKMVVDQVNLLRRARQASEKRAISARRLAVTITSRHLGRKGHDL